MTPVKLGQKWFVEVGGKVFRHPFEVVDKNEERVILHGLDGYFTMHRRQLTAGVFGYFSGSDRQVTLHDQPPTDKLFW